MHWQYMRKLSGTRWRDFTYLIHILKPEIRSFPESDGHVALCSRRLAKAWCTWMSEINSVYIILVVRSRSDLPKIQYADGRTWRFHHVYCISCICIAFYYINILCLFRCCWSKINKMNICCFYSKSNLQKIYHLRQKHLSLYILKQRHLVRKLIKRIFSLLYRK